MTRQEAGRRGGLATHRKHGSAYMAMIGRRGFRAYVEKIYHGDARAAREHLLAAGRIGHPVRCQAYWKALIASGNVNLSFDQWELEQRVITAREIARRQIATITEEHAA